LIEKEANNKNITKFYEKENLNKSKNKNLKKIKL
jgi:hypothetical protein